MNPPKPSDAIPEAALPRLARYLRKLEQLEEEGLETVSSRRLADAVGTNPAQIRKDLSYFGGFGTRGVGYDTHLLVKELRRRLGLDRERRVIIIGAGKLGTALALYRGFAKQGFRLAAMFDADPRVVGSDRGAGPVLSIDELEDFLSAHEVHIAIITTPAEAAQEVIDRVAAAGVPAVLNFAPVRAVAGPGVALRQVDLSTELITLSFYLAGD